MTLLDAKPPRPPSKIRKYAPIVVVALLIVGSTLGFWLRNYPEERAVSRFLTRLEAGDYPEAYRLWKPAPSYRYQDFLHDWGERGDYGKIREFNILDSKSKGSNSVVVTVQINSVQPPLDLVVDRATKGLAYSAF